MDQTFPPFEQGNERTLLGETTEHFLELPPAAPESYLSWMAYWREVETKMLEFPALENLASKDAAPFLHGSIALLLSDVVREITKQSMNAIGEGRGSVSPEIRLELSAELLAEMASYIVLRGDWLGEHARALGIDPLAPQMRTLRSATVEALRRESRRLSGDDEPGPAAAEQ